MTSARQIEESAARWLIRSEEPDWSQRDQAALDAWLAESAAHQVAYWRLEHGWHQADRIRALGPNVLVQDAMATPVRRRWRQMVIAASLIAVASVTLLWKAKEAPAVSPQRYATPVGGHELVPLPDGSKIELNTATVIRAVVSKRSREVWLDQGEAYFEIKRADGRSFVVHAGNQKITVLGTKFSVRRDGGKITVSVVEGRVRVDDAAQTEGLQSSIVTAGDMVIAEGTETLLARGSDERVSNALAWRDGMLAFDGVTLAEAASEFNRYSRMSIVVSDPEVGEIRIGGSFQASNADAFLRLLHDAYGLKIHEEKNVLKISDD